MTAGIAVHRELCFKLGRLFAEAAAEAMVLKPGAYLQGR
mgnify:CR=1 FL=1